MNGMPLGHSLPSAITFRCPFSQLLNLATAPFSQQVSYHSSYTFDEHHLHTVQIQASITIYVFLFLRRIVA